MSLRRHRIAASLIGPAVVVALTALTGQHDLILFAGPVLLALGPLLAGWFPGEVVVRRALQRARATCRRAPAGAGRRPLRPAHRATPRGRSLIAFGLAERPPPALPRIAAA